MQRVLLCLENGFFGAHRLYSVGSTYYTGEDMNILFSWSLQRLL